ncbi:MAG: hypothetical protein JWL77_4361 [Chthonomonadaceae bacterium]|nr:hypothetical protein [Chthonomonadaceae bacterium]
MHSRLEQYLETVAQNLQALPAEERSNELTEIRLHMESLVEANRELGSTEEEAVTLTLAQFGRAQTIGKDLTRVHQSGGKSDLSGLAGAIAFSYFGGMLASLIMSRFFLIALSPSPTPTAWWIARGLLTTVCVGWLTGAVMPRHAIKGTLYAHLVGMGLAGLLTLLFPTSIMPMSPILSTWTMLLASTAVGTSLAMFGAKQGVQWRNARVKAMRLVR